MKLIFTFFFLSIFSFYNAISQDDLNQVIIVNGGQFGNPAEQTNIASFNPTTMDYNVFDTIPVNSVQHIVIENDFAYVAAQDFIVKYDLDTYERVAITDFPGVSAHQIALSDDFVYATNYYGQTEDNLYVFNKSDLSIVDTVHEISAPEGTMVVFGNSLYIGQNQKGTIDNCAPWGCFNDTLGYLAEVNLSTHQFVQNHNLDNNGAETGRLVATDTRILSLNGNSGTITSFNPNNGTSTLVNFNGSIETGRYKNETAVVDNNILSLFDGGIGVLNAYFDSASVVIDTATTAFAFDYLNDVFYITSTDYFSYTDLYVFNGDGSFQYELPIGYAPEAIGIHYNNSPIGNNFETESDDTIIITIADIATDLDGDLIEGNEIIDAPVNGAVTFLPNGELMYRSFSVGSSDFFRVEVCDNKLNPLCTFINVTISGATPVVDQLFESVGIYPNPVGDLLNIQHPVAKSLYTIYDVLGNEVIASKNTQLEVENLAAGTYFLKMVNGDSQRTIPFVKQ